MRRYNVKVRVIQEVEKEIAIYLDALDEADVEKQVEKAMETYPQGVSTNSIHRIYSPSTRYNPPSSLEFLSVVEEKRFA